MDDLIVRIKVTPNSKENRITCLTEEGILALKVSSRPCDGEANDAAVLLLSKSLNIPKSRITIVRGTASRQKTVRIRQWSDAQFKDALALYFSK